MMKLEVINLTTDEQRILLLFTSKSLSWEEEDLASMGDPDRLVTLKDGSEVETSDPHGLEVILR